MFVTFECFRSSNQFRYWTKTTQVNTKCGLEMKVFIIKGMKVQTHISLCENEITCVINHWSHCFTEHVGLWERFYYLRLFLVIFSHSVWEYW